MKWRGGWLEGKFYAIKRLQQERSLRLLNPPSLMSSALDYARKYAAAPGAPAAQPLILRYRLGTSSGVYNREEMQFVSNHLEQPIPIPQVGQPRVLPADMH
ncbi:hypothetical protein RHGRI_028441 [Rhododendron griersonianum]|uniref:Uncharacterized protein n=1 Tax=Rhododendron griersonianum TaxID=479676 RepID=A0AAV6IKJ1_9ERIC|nr:hypothetical protein RHGRI_028441 [Rhododendron griersonianum]